MALNVTGALIEVYKPGADDPVVNDPATTIPSSDILAASEDQRAGEFKDAGGFHIRNDFGAYAGAITSGDKLRFLVDAEGTVGLEHRFTALARTVRYDRAAPNDATIKVEVGDFVSEILSMRRVSLTRESQPIATDGSLSLPDEDLGLINLILKRQCPEIDRSSLPDLPTTVDLAAREQNVRDAIDGLAARADAVVWGEGATIHVTPVADLTVAFTADRNDIAGDYDREVVDDNLANDMRIEGGKNAAMENEQPTVASYVPVGDTAPFETFYFHTRKSETQRIRLWTRRDRTNADPQDGLKLRLQAANDTNDGPVAPGDETSDIVAREISIEFLTDDGWTDFVLGDHTHAERDVWGILVGRGNVEVGVDANGTPAFEQFYPYPLLVRQVDARSVRQHRRRDASEIDRTVRTRAGAQARVRSRLQHKAQPDEVLSVAAESARMHNLLPSALVAIQRPKDAVDGEYVVLDRRDSFSGTRLETTFELQEADSL